MNDYNAKPTLGYKIANKLLFNKIKTALGIEKLSLFYTAGAPLNEDIKEHFSGLDILVRELYGSSESGCLGIAQYPDIKMKVVFGITIQLRRYDFIYPYNIYNSFFNSFIN